MTCLRSPTRDSRVQILSLVDATPWQNVLWKGVLEVSRMGSLKARYNLHCFAAGEKDSPEQASSKALSADCSPVSYEPCCQPRGAELSQAGVLEEVPKASTYGASTLSVRHSLC